MVKLQPYNQGEYICDAYVIIVDATDLALTPLLERN